MSYNACVVFTIEHAVVGLAILVTMILITQVITVIRQGRKIELIRIESDETRRRVIHVANALPRTSREGSLGYHVSMGDEILTPGSNDENQSNV